MMSSNKSVAVLPAVLLRRMPVATAAGPAPVTSVEVGKLLDDTPGIFCELVRLEENCAKETGTRSPTKNVAGWPSSARRRTRRPLRTSERTDEKFAVAPGSVARRVVLPPPNASSGGISVPRPSCPALMSPPT